MQVTFIAFGTRGDVQPALALAKTLRQKGHAVRMIASANFSGWIERHGIQAAPAALDIQAMMMSESGHEWVRHGNNPLRQAGVMKKLLDRYGLSMMQDAWGACWGAELVVSGFTSDIFAVSIAEKLGARHVSIPLQPAMTATRSGMAMASAPLPGRHSWLNRLFGRLVIEPFGWRLMGAINNRFRQESLGLPPHTRLENRQALEGALTLLGYSPQVTPHPPDWPASYHTTGYWFLDQATIPGEAVPPEDGPGWTPPAALQAFLEAGEPPIYVGFGSMTGRDPQALTRLVLSAAQQVGRRLVIQAGWANLGEARLPEGIFLLQAAPHHWLFPHMCAVVHHGGAGTTAESLRAGRPTMIVPHIADQPYWGSRVAALGVGPPPIPRGRLTVANLAGAIHQAATDEAMRQRAEALGRAIRAEDGLAEALRWIEGL